MAIPWLALALMTALATSALYMGGGSVPGPLPSISPVIAPRLDPATVAAAGRPVSAGPQVVFHTTQGDVVVTTFPDQAPMGVRHFLRTVEWERFRHESFWRVAPGDYVELGSPDTDVAGWMRDRLSESNALPQVAGSLVLWRTALDSGQAAYRYAIVTEPGGHYPGVVIGQVAMGLEVARRLRRSDTLLGAEWLLPADPGASRL